MVIIIPILHIRDRGTNRLSDLPKVSQIVRGDSRTQSLCSNHTFHPYPKSSPASTLSPHFNRTCRKDCQYREFLTQISGTISPRLGAPVPRVCPSFYLTSTLVSS